MDVKQEILAIDTGQILRPRDWPARVPAWLHRPRAAPRGVSGEGEWAAGLRGQQHDTV